MILLNCNPIFNAWEDLIDAGQRRFSRWFSVRWETLSPPKGPQKRLAEAKHLHVLYSEFMHLHLLEKLLNSWSLMMWGSWPGVSGSLELHNWCSPFNLSKYIWPIFILYVRTAYWHTACIHARTVCMCAFSNAVLHVVTLSRKPVNFLHDRWNSSWACSSCTKHSAKAPDALQLREIPTNCYLQAISTSTCASCRKPCSTSSCGKRLQQIFVCILLNLWSCSCASGLCFCWSSS